MDRSRVGVIAILGSTQTLAWASSYYLPAILADRMAQDLRCSTSIVFAAVSIALVVSALLGPRIGRRIDLVGGRGVLAVSNVVFAAGLVLVAMATDLMTFTLGWLVIGTGMALGLYDTAFATLSRLYGGTARSAITGITLIAGFASTIGWPLTAWGNEAFGWRETCLGWAAAHMLLGLPLNLMFIPTAKIVPAAASPAAEGSPGEVVMDTRMWLLAYAFAAGWVVSTAMAAHLPRILEAAGATQAQAIVAGMLIGPAQVAARFLEAGLLRRIHPLTSARLATLGHPAGAAVLLMIGGAVPVAAFALLHGAGNGILTIARGTVPHAIFGPENYGYRLGLLGAPARIAQAASPLLFAYLLDGMGANLLVVSTGLCLSAGLALCFVRRVR
jgi:predicted MFS family arabinose efflux permease